MNSCTADEILFPKHPTVVVITKDFLEYFLSSLSVGVFF